MEALLEPLPIGDREKLAFGFVGDHLQEFRVDRHVRLAPNRAAKKSFAAFDFGLAAYSHQDREDFYAHRFGQRCCLGGRYIARV